MELIGLTIALLVAVAVGYALGGGRQDRAVGSQRQPPSEVFRGLNFLLNDQPDRAIDAFLRALDVDADTLETHLALGGLLRRRGEVERAIRIHQNLLARPGQLRSLRPRVELELARDYLTAGLFDRAESLLKGLVAGRDVGPEVAASARADLLSVYERERDWTSAAALARHVASRGDPEQRARIAHYHCEQADLALAANDLRAARKALQQALAQDARSVRALLSLAELELLRERPREALRHARRLPDIDPGYLGESMDLMERAHRQLDTLADYLRTLQRLLGRRSDLPVLARIARIQRETGLDLVDTGPALRACVEAEPSLEGLRVILAEAVVSDADGATLLQLIEQLLQRANGYQCGECGFTAQRRDWQCPSCRTWGSLHRHTAEPQDALAQRGA